VAVDTDRTTGAVQQYLDALADVNGDSPAEPIVRALLARAVDRLHLLCASLLHRSYPRLTRGPLNLRSEEMLGAVVERLMKAMRQVRPTNVRQFFALANQHMRWELNDLARRLDEQAAPIELRDSLVGAPPEASTASPSQVSPNTARILEAIAGLPEDEREAFNLVRIQGLTQPEAADVIGCSVKTVQRRLNRSLVLLAEAVGDLRRPPPPDRYASDAPV
jgi:RNA polymerase sigma factor (sigma-70 family)